MRAYYFDNLPGDQRLPHDYVPSRPVPQEVLEKINVKHWQIPVEEYEPKVDAIAKERGYKNRDTINVSKDGLGDAYEEKIKNFFHEHMHEDEEIRYILSGTGFFDVREAKSDDWIRLAVEPGDMIVIPAGIYHRFTLDEANKIQALRLFQDEPKWTPHNRSQETDVNPYRIQYLSEIDVGA
ncbi:Acireductone dioxygenase ARD family [Crepidotus variabilis]|uniref:Acireductone dioxygenase n=1 Tax=Crepidotus variabilis TaxID=179855 RepID=A0A9P6E7C1_9AGAR|nr:Acireductone dioxygenase ARD family [Crepidotus variabilis]